jgi:hypothetical protein
MTLYIRGLWYNSAAVPMISRSFLGSGLDPTSLHLDHPLRDARCCELYPAQEDSVTCQIIID